MTVEQKMKTPTERICELYNVDLSFFKKSEQ